MKEKEYDHSTQVVGCQASKVVQISKFKVLLYIGKKVCAEEFSIFGTKLGRFLREAGFAKGRSAGNTLGFASPKATLRALGRYSNKHLDTDRPSQAGETTL